MTTHGLTAALILVLLSAPLIGRDDPVRVEIKQRRLVAVCVDASSTAFSSEVWRKGEWAPVVRDRSVDMIVSDPPVPADGSCGSK